MKRQFLTDRSGRWFDVEEAEYWEGGESGGRLYKTLDENFILRTTLLRDGMEDDVSYDWSRIEPADAYNWLADNGHGEELPDAELEKRKL